MKQHIQRIKEKISEHRKELFFIFLIFLLAFGTRAYLMKYDLFFEFDGYWHARMISYIIQSGTYPAADPMAYYQIGGSPTYVGADFFWYLCAGIYKVFTLNAPYDKNLWFLFVKILPALFGALIAIVAYFIGKEAFNDKRAGYLLGFFAATMPAFVYRQMAGWLEDDSFGFLPGLIATYFIIKALKAKEWKSKEFAINAILAGLFTGIMGWSWSGFQIMPLIIAMFAVLALIVLFINSKFFEEKEFGSKAVKVIVVSVIAVGIMAVIVFPHAQFNWVKASVGGATKILPGGAGITGGEGGVIGQSVGEESVGLNFFGNKYNFLIILLPIGIIALLYAAWRHKNYAALLLFSILLTTMIMGISKLKFTYYFGLGMAIASGVAIYYLIKIAESRGRQAKIAIAAFSCFMLLTGVAAGSFFVSQNIPNIEQNIGWKEALNWMQVNTPVNSKFFNWWDEGHWITLIGERKVILDNRNYDGQAEADFAKFVITPNNDEAIGIISQAKYNPDYLIISSDLLEKGASLVTYAFGTTDLNSEMQPYLTAYGFSMPCVKTVAEVSKQVSYNCQSNALNEVQWNNLPSEWQSSPNQVQGQTVLFAYKSVDKEGNAKLVILTPQANNSIMAKLWFGNPELKSKFEQVYFFKEVKIFKVK